jgi:HEAT repeat protein
VNSGRSSFALILVGVLFAGAAWWALRSMFSGAEPERAEVVAEDDRVAWLTAPCGFTRVFDLDTSNMVHILVESLGWGQRDPLPRARMELAAAGPSVLPELRRAFEASYAQAFEHGVLENILGVCTVAEDGWGLELLRSGASHPAETVRAAAVTGLAKHGDASDYELVRRCLDMGTTKSTRSEAVASMSALDPERLGRDLVSWIEGAEHQDQWPFAASLMGRVHEPAIVARLAALADRVLVDARFLLLAPAARDGDAAALAELREGLGMGELGMREFAINALAVVGLGLEGRAMLELDPDRRLRVRAAAVISSMGPGPETIAALSIGLSDRDSEVREACLQRLCTWGDERAVAQAMELLRGTVNQRLVGLRALRSAFETQPGLDDRVRAFVLDLMPRREGPIDALETGFLQTLSQVPGRESAEILLQRARNATGRITDWRAHRWCIHQSINTGPEGRAVLLAALEEESDPLRQIDLIEAASQDRDEAVREMLRRVIEDPAIDPNVRVFASHRLILQGPAAEVAPYLKRVYLANTEELVRSPLGCMLWAWYGASRP